MAVWFPYSESRARLSSYLDRLRDNLPEEFFSLAGLKRDRLSKSDAVDLFAICGREDFKSKARALAQAGVEELIIEYFEPSELERLAQ